MDAQDQNWDDYRLFLAVAQAGSLSGAARLLGVTHSTVFRRLVAFEERLGVRLFQRLPSGYVLTAAGEAMESAATRIDNEIAGIRRQVVGQDQGIKGTLEAHDWIGFASGHAPLRKALADWLPNLRPQFRTNSISAAVTAARAGIGLAALPCAIADPDPELVRIAPFPDDFGLDLWLLTHEDLRHTARIRAFVDFMSKALAEKADLFEGRAPRREDSK